MERENWELMDHVLDHLDAFCCCLKLYLLKKNSEKKTAKKDLKGIKKGVCCPLSLCSMLCLSLPEWGTVTFYFKKLLFSVPLCRISFIVAAQFLFEILHEEYINCNWYHGSTG